MSVQTVGNTSQSVQQVSQQAAKNQAVAFVNLDDSQLRILAQNANYTRSDAKKEKAKTAALFCAIPMIDSIGKGILHESSSMGEKVLRGGNAAAGWCGIIAFIEAYSLAKKFLAKHSDTAANFQANSPGISFAVDLGAILGASMLGTSIISKAINAHPSIGNKLFEIGDKVKKGIDKTKLNNKFLPWITEKVSKFEKIAPRTLGAGKFVLRNSMWFMLGATLLSYMHHSSKIERKVNDNYVKLKTAQIQTAEYLKAHGEI